MRHEAVPALQVAHAWLTHVAMTAELCCLCFCLCFLSAQALEAELKLLAAKNVDLQKKANNLKGARSHVAEVQDLWQGAYQHLALLNEALGTADKQINGLCGQLDDADTQQAGLQKVLDAANQRIGDLLREERLRIETVQAAQEQQQRLQQQRLELAHQETAQQLRETQERLADAQAQAKSARQEVVALSAQLAESADANARQISDNDALRARLADTQAQAEAARQEVADLSAKLVESTLSAAHQITENDELRVCLTEAQAQAESASQEVAALSAQLQQAEAESANAHARHVADSDALKERLAAAQAQGESAMQEVTALSAKLAESADVSACHMASNDALRKRVAALETELVSAAGAAQQSTAQATALKQAQKELSQRLDLALEAVENVMADKEQVEAYLQDKAQLISQLKSQQAENALMQQQHTEQVAAFKAQLLAQAALVRQCKAQAEEAFQALEEDEQRLAGVQAQLEAAQLEKEGIASLLESVQLERAYLQSKIDEIITVTAQPLPRAAPRQDRKSLLQTQPAAPDKSLSVSTAQLDVTKQASMPSLSLKAQPSAGQFEKVHAGPQAVTVQCAALKQELDLEPPATPSGGYRDARHSTSAAHHSPRLLRRTGSSAPPAQPADMPATLRNLHSEDTVLQAQAVVQLRALVSPSSGSDAAAAQQAVLASLDRLVQLLGCSKDARVNRDIAWIFACLSDRPKDHSATTSNAAMIAGAPSCLERLAGLLNCVYDDVQEAATRALGALARNDPASKVAIGKVPGCIVRLVLLLKSSRQDGVLEAVAAALGYLAHECPVNQLAIASIPGCLTRLRALAAGTHGVRGRALHAQQSFKGAQPVAQQGATQA